MKKQHVICGTQTFSHQTLKDTENENSVIYLSACYSDPVLFRSVFFCERPTFYFPYKVDGDLLYTVKLQNDKKICKCPYDLGTKSIKPVCEEHTERCRFIFPNYEYEPQINVTLDHKTCHKAQFF